MFTQRENIQDRKYMYIWAFLKLQNRKVILYLGIQCYKLWSFITLFLCLHILLYFLQKGNWHFWQPALEFCQRDDKLKFWEFMCLGMLCLVWNGMIRWFLSEHVFQAEYKQAVLLTRKGEGKDKRMKSFPSPSSPDGTIENYIVV